MQTITLRLPTDQHQALRDLAAREGVSMNQLVGRIVGDYIRTDEEQRLYDDFTLLGSDPEAADVEFGINAAAEVVLKNE